MVRCVYAGICLTVCAMFPAQAAETGRSAFEAWVNSDMAAGVSATYGSAEDNGDVLTVRDFTYAISNDIDLSWLESSDTGPSDEAETFSVEVKLTVPELVATRFASDSNGFSADLMTMSEDTAISARLQLSDDEGLAIDGWIKGFVSKGVFWPRLPAVEVDSRRPLESFIPLLDAMILAKFEETGMAEFGMRLRPIGDDGGSVVYTVQDMVAKGLENGRFAEMRQGPSRQVLSAPEGDEFQNMTTTIAEVRYEDYDLAPVIDLFVGSGDTEPEYKRALGSVSVLGYRVESEHLDARIDRMAYDDFFVRAPQKGLAELIDDVIEQRELVDEIGFLSAAFEFYRSIAFGRISVDGVSLSFSDPEEPWISGTFKLDQFLVSDFSSDGLGEFSLSGFELGIDDAGEGVFDRFSIEDLEFAPYAPMLEFFRTLNDGAGEPDPLVTSRLFAPRSVSVSLDGLHVDAREEGFFDLDRLFIGFSSIVPPVPTEIELNVEGLEFPVALIEEREARAVFEAAGIDTLRLAERFRVFWDEEAEDLVIEDLSIEIGQVGVVQAAARIGGVTRSILEDPQTAQMAIVSLSLKSIELELINEGGVESALGIAASEAGVEPGQMADLLLAQLQGILATIGNEAFANEVSEAAKTFFADPNNVRLEVVPPSPVPIMQIIGSAQLAPQTLPELLGVTIETNR